jgi:hypothetical protein
MTMHKKDMSEQVTQQMKRPEAARANHLNEDFPHSREN